MCYIPDRLANSVPARSAAEAVRHRKNNCNGDPLEKRGLSDRAHSAAQFEFWIRAVRPERVELPDAIIQPDLGLTNTQIGLTSGALSLTWSFAAFGIGAVADRTGRRKGLLLLATLAFSVCSCASGLVSSLAMLLGARLLMGVAEGGIMPISQSLIASEVDARYRGLAMGVAQGLGSCFHCSWLRFRRRVSMRDTSPVRSVSAWERAS